MKLASPWRVAWPIILLLAACQSPEASVPSATNTMAATASVTIAGADSASGPESQPGQESPTSGPASITPRPTSTIALTAEAQATQAAATVPPTYTAVASPTAAETSMPPPSAEPASATPTEPLPEATATEQPLPTTAPLNTPVNSAAEFSIIPAAPPVGAAAPTAYVTTLSIPTYNYEQAFIPTAEDDPVYPYPRLNFEAVGPPTPRTYQAVVLENGFTSLTILPELGGRIYRWVDKATGRHLLYENPIVKPTGWGVRGWWLAAGGIEWAFPLEEHGLVEYQPWNYSIGSGSVTVSTVDQRTGMEVGATISLDAGHAYMTIQPWARNNTDTAHQYQLWLNAMLSLGGNAVSPQTQFIVPAPEVIIHSSGASGVPASGGSMSWPAGSGRDMSWYGSWDGHLGFFVLGVGYVGLYDHAADQGVARVHAPGWPAGTKFFGPATISPSTWTDDGSNYVELWSGATGSFWSYATLEPGASVGWTERWYPVSRIGGFNYANANAVLRLQDTGGGAEIGVAVSGGASGVIRLYVNNQEMANWPVTLYPGQAFRASWMRPAGLEGALGLSFKDNQGNVLAHTGQVPQ